MGSHTSLHDAGNRRRHLRGYHHGPGENRRPVNRLNTQPENNLHHALGHYRASARQTHCPALQACKPQAQRFGADQKRRIDQSKTRVRGRQSGARALGRRSDRRVEEQLYSDPSGTPFAVCDAGQSRQQGHRKRHLWANQIGTEIATRTLQVPDMGSRQRAGRSPAPDHSDRYRRLLQYLELHSKRKPTGISR